MAKSKETTEIILVAATEIELCERPGLVCGVGPIEAAVATARELALRPPPAVLHVGIEIGRASCREREL